MSPPDKKNKWKEKEKEKEEGADKAPDNGWALSKRRRRAFDQDDTTSMWLVSFTDVMALMLTFFVLLFAMSHPKKENWEDFSENVKKQFNKFYGQALNRGTQDSISIEKINLNTALDLNYIKTLLEKQIQEDSTLNIIKMINQPDGLILSFPDNLLFESGSTVVTRQGSDALFVVAQTLERYKNRIEVIGHADPRPLPAGAQFASNWDLSLTRAASVAAALENFGYEKDLIIRGQGSGRYQDLSDTLPVDKRLSLSRRVDIVIRADTGQKMNMLEFQ